MRARRKLKNNKGFSLAETLLAVLILLLVSTIVANGIPVAQNVYNKVIIGANAQLLLSTAVTALRNELGTARRITVATDGKSIIYYKASINAFSKIDLNTVDKSIQVTDYVDPESDGWPMIPMRDKDGNVIPAKDDPRPRRLVTNSASNKNLIVTCEPESSSDPIIKYDTKDMIQFYGIVVKNTEGDKVITELETLNIRIIPLTAEAEA